MTDMDVNTEINNMQNKSCPLQEPIRTFVWFQHSFHVVKGVSYCCCSSSTAYRTDFVRRTVRACKKRFKVVDQAWIHPSSVYTNVLNIFFARVPFAISKS